MPFVDVRCDGDNCVECVMDAIGLDEPILSEG